MVDTNGYEKIEAAAKLTQAAVDEGRWSDATDEWATTEYVIIAETNNIDFYNILYKMAPRTYSTARAGNIARIIVQFFCSNIKLKLHQLKCRYSVCICSLHVCIWIELFSILSKLCHARHVFLTYLIHSTFVK